MLFSQQSARDREKKNLIHCSTHEILRCTIFQWNSSDLLALPPRKRISKAKFLTLQHRNQKKHFHISIDFSETFMFPLLCRIIKERNCIETMGLCDTKRIIHGFCAQKNLLWLFTTYHNITTPAWQYFLYRVCLTREKHKKHETISRKEGRGEVNYDAIQLNPIEFVVLFSFFFMKSRKNLNQDFLKVHRCMIFVGICCKVDELNLISKIFYFQNSSPPDGVISILCPSLSSIIKIFFSFRGRVAWVNSLVMFSLRSTLFEHD